MISLRQRIISIKSRMIRVRGELILVVSRIILVTHKIMSVTHTIISVTQSIILVTHTRHGSTTNRKFTESYCRQRKQCKRQSTQRNQLKLSGMTKEINATSVSTRTLAMPQQFNAETSF